MKIAKDKDLQICPVKRLYLELEENLPDTKTIAIVLTTEKINHPNMRMLDNCHKVEVMDTEIENKAFSFNYDEGLKVKEFLDRENDFGRLYVCCDSGESRSTAMAAAVMRYYGESDKQIWTNPYYHPNLLVYKKQLNAFGIKISRLRLKYLKYINDRALKKAMNEGR